MNVRHSGNLGDIIYSLPCIQAMAKKDLVDLILVTGVRQSYGEPHPLGNVRLTNEWAESLRPLLEAQKYINSVTVIDEAEFQARYDNTPLTNLDQFRRADLNPNQGPAQRWFLWSHAQHADLAKSVLQVEPSQESKDFWIVNRTSRNQNPFINWRLLRDLPCAFFGLPEEYGELKRTLPELVYFPVRDYLHMASLIQGAKGFIGNQSFCFALAESLKVPRLLETPLNYANVVPIGGTCFEARSAMAWESALEELTQAKKSIDYEARTETPLVFFHQQDLTACSLYRSTMPAHFLNQLLMGKITCEVSNLLPIENKYKAINLQRVIKGTFLSAVRRFQGEGKKFIWDTDDLFTQLPETNPAYRDVDDAVKEHLLEVAEAADYITTTTPFLKEILGHPEKTFVLPNLVDPNIYPTVKRPERDFVRILWAGSPSHDADLAQLEPVYHALKEKYGAKIQWVFMGYHPTWACDYVRRPGDPVAHLKSRWSDVGFVQAVPLSHYAASICELAPDIAVCPLTTCIFNRAKSPIKWMEMTLAGAAVVATDLEPYHPARRLACLVPDGNTQWWVSTLTRMIESPEWRVNLQQEALRRVHSDHSWWSELATKPWRDFYGKLAQGEL